MSGAAEQVEGIFKNYGSSGLLVLLTVGMEELAAFLIFECPCNIGNMDNFVYGMSYLLGPAIILFLIGLAYQVLNLVRDPRTGRGDNDHSRVNFGNW